MAQDKQFLRECQAAYLMVKEELEETLSNVDELALALQQAGRNPSRKSLTKYWTSSESSIGFAQFCDILKDVNETSAEQLQQAFRKLDRNRDGHISFDELKAMLLKMDEKFTDKELHDIFSSADLNKDGNINYEEFVRLMCETADETKRRALAQLEKRERRENRQKKRERREQALNGSAVNGEAVPSSHKQTDELSVSSRSSGSAGTSGARTNKGRSVLPADKPPPKPSTSDDQSGHHIKRKGCFFYDIDSDEDGGRAEIVSHQYKIILKQKSKISVSIRPTGIPDIRGSETVDTLLLIADNSGQIVCFTKDKTQATYSLQTELPSGEYWFIPFTSGCRFRPRVMMNSDSTKPKVELLSKSKDGTMKLTKEFRMILMNIFDACDLDDNGTLNREEFNIYNVRTGDEQVTDEEWKVVQQKQNFISVDKLCQYMHGAWSWTQVCPTKGIIDILDIPFLLLVTALENFDKKNGEITIRGFIDLHQLEADDSGGDTEDMWISLHAMGYNDRLQLDEACPFLLEIRSDEPIAEIKASEIQPVSQRVWENFAKHLITKAEQRPSKKPNLSVYCYSNSYWAAIIAENKASDTVHAALSLAGSENFSVSPVDVIKRELIFRGSSTSILCFLLRTDEEEEWNIEAELLNV